MITVGELFAGIGGIGLGLEMTGGFEVRWQVERDPYATRVLEKNWPDVKRWDDVTTFPPTESDVWNVDLIAGGFPCQDISLAGKGAGLKGERSGLFYEIVRIAERLRPKYLLLENVSALLVRGMGEVLGALAEVGYDAEWHCIPAIAVGAPHRRDRVFIIANSQHNGRDRVRANERKRKREEMGRGKQSGRDGSNGEMAYASGYRCAKDAKRFPKPRSKAGSTIQHEKERAENIYPDPGGKRRQGGSVQPFLWQPNLPGKLKGIRENVGVGQWAIEPQLGRVANGVPSRVDRIRCLGNAVVPQVAQFIGEQILRVHNGPDVTQ